MFNEQEFMRDYNNAPEIHKAFLVEMVLVMYVECYNVAKYIAKNDKGMTDKEKTEKKIIMEYISEGRSIYSALLHQDFLKFFTGEFLKDTTVIKVSKKIPSKIRSEIMNQEKMMRVAKIIKSNIGMHGSFKSFDEFERDLYALTRKMSSIKSRVIKQAMY